MTDPFCTIGHGKKPRERRSRRQGKGGAGLRPKGPTPSSTDGWYVSSDFVILRFGPLSPSCRYQALVLLWEVSWRMADIFTKEKRSSVMSAIRSGGNLGTELKLIMIFKQYGVTGWRRNVQLPGKPDFVFPRERLAIFVDGCFWHGCPLHGRNPDSNREYWLPKLARNRARDLAVVRELRRRGWRVIRLWEHVLRHPSRVVSRCSRALLKPPTKLYQGRGCLPT